MSELDEVYWCGTCNRQQQPTSGSLCIACGMITAVWATKTIRHPPRVAWNLNNGFPADYTQNQARGDRKFQSVNEAFAKKNRQPLQRQYGPATPGGIMSTQARFDPNLVEAFAAKLEVYIRTLDDYESQVSNALQRLGDTFDDEDYREICDEFVATKALLRNMIEASEVEILRIEVMCADVRANQAVRAGG